MTLTVVWSIQARNQFIATLTYIAKEDPLSAEMVHKRVKSRSHSYATPQKWVFRPQLPACELTQYPKPVTTSTIGWCAIKSGFNAGTGNGGSLFLLP